MKKTMMCIVGAVMVLALAPGAWAGEVEASGGCVTLQELVNAPQATEMIAIQPFGRYKTAKVTVCETVHPNGTATGPQCETFYEASASYACPNGGNPGSSSCSVKGSCNIQPPGSGTGTECECSHWCVTSNFEPADPQPL